MCWPHAQFAHPAFTPVHHWLVGFAAFPDHAAWLDVANRPQTHSGHTVTFVDPDSVTGYYETEIHEFGRVSTRPDNWHDLFNALIWLRFPAAKAALNALHYQHLSQARQGQRGPARDAATLFDECGLVVPYCNHGLIDALRQHQWADLFVVNKALWGKQIGAFCFGHANLEALLDPFTGLTGKCWPIEVAPEFFELPQEQQLAQLDSGIALLISNGQLQSPRQLPPLPYLGIPGWWPQQDAAFYGDTSYFRPARAKAVRPD